MVGLTLSPLPPGPVWRWDRGGVVEVELSSGAIPSIPDEAALAGGNLFALKGPDGAWEVVSAARSEMTGERRFRLSRLLRGLGGTEASAARALPAGSVVVRLDEAVTPIGEGLSDLGRPWIYRSGPIDSDHAGPAVAQFAAAAGPGALRPLAPVRLTARRSPAGVEIAWIRRTRLDGDPWEPLDVPLAEEREAYLVEVLRDGAALARAETAVPRWLYPAARELADLGSPQAVLDLRVAQLSAAVGEGA